MFFKLFSTEWTRLNRRAIFWVTLVTSALFIFYNQQHFYSANIAELLNGDLTLPGFSFDLATSLDQIGLIAQPLMVIITALILGNDYKQRTNQHWLMRASRSSSILAKFLLLVLLTFALQILTMLIGGVVGWYYKIFTFDAFSFANINWGATLAAPFYMTLATLPALAFTLLVVVLSRSSFLGITIGLGYTQFLELLLTGFGYGASWSGWIMRNLTLSATFLLNDIGNKTVNIPGYLLAPAPALIMAAVYTLIFLTASLWFYRRQDLGG